MHRVSPTAAYTTIVGTQGLAQGLLFAALVSYWVLQAHLNPLELVLLGTALEGTLFVFQVPTGAFADAVGRRPATVIGYVGLGVAFGLQALTRDFASLIVLQALSGIAWAFLIGSIEAWIADRAGTDGLERVFLRGEQADLVGLMAGLVVTIFLGQIDARLPIFVGGTILVLAGVAAAILMVERRPERSPIPRSRWREMVTVARTGLGRIGASRVLLLLVLVALALGVSSEGWDRLYTAHLMRGLGLDSVGGLSPVGWLAVIGLIQSVIGIGVFQVAARRLSGARPGIFLGTLIVSRAIFMLGFALLPSLPLAVVAFIAAQTLRRLGGPLLDAWVARETPEEVRATVFSVMGQADSLGEIVAGPLVGVLGLVTSIRAALSVSAALILPAALLVLRADRPRIELDSDGVAGGAS